MLSIITKPNYFSFGKQIPGSHRRESECMALEDSVLLLVSLNCFVDSMFKKIEDYLLYKVDLVDTK